MGGWEVRFGIRRFGRDTRGGPSGKQNPGKRKKFFETKTGAPCSKQWEEFPHNIMKKFAVVAAIVALISPLAMAKEKGEGKPKPTPEERFKKLDANGDGKLTLEEYTGKQDAEKAKEHFKALDKDGDGSLTLEEFSAKPEGKKKKKAE